MKTIPSLTSALTLLTLGFLPAEATTYTGTGNSLDSSPADGAAISSVVVNNDASSISFTINSTEPQASYIFYAIELQIIGQASSGYTGFANPFGPAIGISTGENAVIDTYGTGATPYTYTDGSWLEGISVSYTAGGTGDTYSTIDVPLSSIGLSAGESFYFDVVSTYTSQANGGPQSAYGALDSVTGYPAESDDSYTPYNGTSHYDSVTDASGTTFGTSASEYTVETVPEPTACALVGLGVLAIVCQKMRRNASL